MSEMLNDRRLDFDVAGQNTVLLLSVLLAGGTTSTWDSDEDVKVVRTAVERFVRREPLRRVHECVFGVLALESEPVDPRL